MLLLILVLCGTDVALLKAFHESVSTWANLLVSDLRGIVEDRIRHIL